MRSFIVLIFGFLLLLPFSCKNSGAVISDQFVQVNESGWHWNDARKLSFTITDSSFYYDVDCGLRISGSYRYSNIWLIYTLNGPGIQKKEQFEVVLSDNTGKWLGKGQSNLLSYERNFIRGAKLKPGNYTLEFSQNMRDEKLKSVSDIGVKVRRSGKVY